MKKLCVLLLIFWSCGKGEIIKNSEKATIPFNSQQWQQKDEGAYIHRSAMVDEILYTDRIRKLPFKEILDTLGDPDRQENGHYYYVVSRKMMGNWTLNAKTLVLKKDSTGLVEWIKLHG